MSSGDNYVADGPAVIGWNLGMGRLEVSLPHQCDDWVIGDADAVRVLIADLTVLLPEFEHPEKYRHEHACVNCGATIVREGGEPCACKTLSNGGLCSTCFFAPQARA
jgi:hypothetical protein